MRRRELLQAGSLATAAALADCTVPGVSGTSEMTTRTLDVPDRTPIGVENQNGRVTVETHDASEVELDVTRESSFGSGRFDEVSVETGADDGTYTVAVSYDNDAAPDARRRPSRCHCSDEPARHRGSHR
ncbi:hypothetical protein DM2_2259 [Halorubrum sp. DM2]|uniref:hypothetical protein n=1 Tax=Halorubrum sp. DM2 TaxID=2527867 RepID=UPI0024B770AE|nr:hypothetical protein [Halorubrum sp. DM2]VTT86221.1 hypothetical protein DM2_2259 [Halorubrum sp. DM2]